MLTTKEIDTDRKKSRCYGRRTKQIRVHFLLLYSFFLIQLCTSPDAAITKLLRLHLLLLQRRQLQGTHVNRRHSHSLPY